MYEIKKSADGTLTLYSKEYGECYHSLKDGALREALYKHVIPAFTYTSKTHLRILDICFGLGINTLATLYYLRQQKRVKSVQIFSPELDRDLLCKLPTFPYPKELLPFASILKELIAQGLYRDKYCSIELFVGDARDYIKELTDIDVVYQDPFSPKKNPALWTVEYFEQIASILRRDGILTTYSIAAPVLLALDEVGFSLYRWEPPSLKRGTIASFKELSLPKIDMQRKRLHTTSMPYRDGSVL